MLRVSTAAGLVLAMTAGAVAVHATLTAGQSPAASAQAPAGRVFVTGHDSDFHAQPASGGGTHNAAGARHIVQRAVAHVTKGMAAPRLLYVAGHNTAVRDGPVAREDVARGMEASGFPPCPAGGPSPPGCFELADARSGRSGAEDLSTVSFGSYDAVVVASGHECCLGGDELSALVLRKGELGAYLERGGGLVVFSECGRTRRRGRCPGGGELQSTELFGFLPFRLAYTVTGSVDERGFTVTDEGRAIGLSEADVNGNQSHDTFGTDPPDGLCAVDRDEAGRIVSLATWSEPCVPPPAADAPSDAATAPPAVRLRLANDEVREPGAGQTITARLAVTLDRRSDVAVTVGYATRDGSATAGRDYRATRGTVTVPAGLTAASIGVRIAGDGNPERTERFGVDLDRPSGVTVADGRGTVTIRDDDRAVEREPDRSEGAGQGESQGQVQPQTKAQGQGQTVAASTSQGQGQTAAASASQAQSQGASQSQAQQQVQSQAQGQPSPGRAPGHQSGVTAARQRGIDARPAPAEAAADRDPELLASARGAPAPGSIAVGWVAALMMFAFAALWLRREERAAVGRLAPDRGHRSEVCARAAGDDGRRLADRPGFAPRRPPPGERTVSARLGRR